MKKIILLITLLLVLNGCIDLVQNGEETISLNYSETGSVFFEHTIKGEKGSLFYEWEGDCTQKVKGLLDSNISNLQKQTIEIQNSNASEEEKTDLIEENNRKINTFLSIKSTIRCKLEDDNSTAVLIYSFNLSQGFENIKLFNKNYDFSLIKNEKTFESKILINSTANQNTGNKLTKILINSKNGIQEIEPKENIELKGETYEIDMNEMNGKEILITINRSQKTLIKPDKKTVDVFTLLIQGFMPDKLFSLQKDDWVQWIPVIIILILLAIAIGKLIKVLKETGMIKGIGKKEPAIKPEIKDDTANKFLYMQKARKSTTKMMKAKFNEEEKKQIKLIIMTLKETFQNFSKEEIRKAVLGKGYSEKVSEEVADFFYP